MSLDLDKPIEIGDKIPNQMDIHVDKIKLRIKTLLDCGIEQKNTSTILEEIKLMLNCDGWKTKDSINPNAKGVAFENPDFGTISGGKLDENGKLDLDNFIFILKWGGTLIRLKGGDVRYINLKKNQV